MPDAKREQAQTDEPAKLLDAWVTFPSAAATGGMHGHPHLIADGGAVDRLQHQIEGEGELEFADDDGRRLTLFEGHQITTTHLALNLEAQRFEEALNGQVET